MRLLLLVLVSFTEVVCGQTRVVVISHLGEHLHHPENTLPAFRATFEAGADFIEADARTNGSGAVKDMTFEQIRALDAGLISGQEFARTHVLTFDEVLEFADGKIGVYVDTKRASAADIIVAIERQDMQDDVVAALRPKIKVMPESVNIAVTPRPMPMWIVWAMPIALQSGRMR